MKPFLFVRNGDVSGMGIIILTWSLKITLFPRKIPRIFLSIIIVDVK